MVARPGRLRSMLLAGVAMLIPVVAFAAIELGLRLFGSGSGYPLFVESPEDGDYLMPNPDVIERYFPAHAAPALAIGTNYFLREKPQDGIRIFVQGESAAAGFPFERGVSLAPLLGYRLARSFPDRHVEVVDTAMAAVSSYMLLDFVDDIVAQQPDAVLIYAGHNEFIGLLGVSSAADGPGTHALKRLTLSVERFRLYQLARDIYSRLQIAVGRSPQLEGSTLMAQLARTQEVPLGSETFERGIEQWKQNLSAIVERYSAAGIPVFVATVTSNLKDQPPFASASGPDSAEQYFAAAGVLEQRGEFNEARRLYELARDHDLLRFRAPTAINEATIEIARTTAAEFVDVAAAFDAASPQGIVGEELLLEHVHPNVEGYFLLADTFYWSLADAGIPAPYPVTIPTEVAREEIWIFPAEVWFAKAAIATLRADFPFSPTPQAPELPPVQSASDALGRAWFNNEIDWLEMAEGSRELVADDPLRRALASERIAAALPFRRDLVERASADRLAAGRPGR